MCLKTYVNYKKETIQPKCTPRSKLDLVQNNCEEVYHKINKFKQP